MVVSFKDGVKFFGIAVISFCAVLVCNMFLNYDIDLRAVGATVPAGGEELYEALLLNNVVVCAVAGGCLLLTSVVMLVFYIGTHIEKNSPKFGILKALGYGEWNIAARCWGFGFCVLVGATAGYAVSWTVMPTFYRLQNEGGAGICEAALRFHPALLFALVILPSALFSAVSIVIAYVKLKTPALALIRGNTIKEKIKKNKPARGNKNFLTEFAFGVINQNKTLAFFVAFGGFCFSSMTQMGLSMRDYASNLMGGMILTIGLVLAAVSLWLSMTAVVGGNAKKIAMLKVSGYPLKECGLSVLGLYHIPAYIGFAVGAAYQYGLLNVMVNIVFAKFDDIPVYSFDWALFAVCFALFVVAYEALTAAYVFVVGRTSVKKVMSE